MKFLIIIFSFIFILSSCSKEEEKIIKKYYNTTTVASWSINDWHSYVWYTDSFDTIMLWAKVWWKIVNINKEVWAKVKVWEIVANLDGIEAKTWYNSSENIITQLELLKTSTSQTFDKQILVTEEKLNQIQVWIDIADIWIVWTTSWLSDIKNINIESLKTVQSQIEQAKVWLETAKLNLENNKSNLNQKEIDLYNNSKNSISNANNLMVAIIDFLDNLLWVTDSNKYKNDSFETYLWAKDISIKNNTENNLRILISKFDEIKKLPLDTNENIENTLNKYNEFFSNDTRILLKNTYKLMENSISSSSFNDSIINSYKTQITTLQQNLEQVILTVSGNYFLWLKWSIDSISNFKKESKNWIDMLQKQVDLATKQLDTLNQTYIQYQAQSKWQITDINTKKDISNKQKELSKKQLTEILASIEALKKQKETSLKQIDTQIAQVKAWKNDASIMIENSKIISPISWIVVKKMAEVWQVVWWWTPVIVVASNNDIKVVAYIEDEIKQKLFPWNEVKVEIEWIKEIKNWIITNILPTLDPITKKTWIEIKIINKDNLIKIWSYTKVFFDTILNKDNEIIIPNNAIVSNYLIPWVYVLKDNKAIFIKIEIIKSSDNFSSIKWLNIWEKIITDWKENIFDGEILK